MEQNKTADCLYQDDIKSWSQLKVVSVLTFSLKFLEHHGVFNYLSSLIK